MKIHFLLTQDLESPAGSGRYFPLAKALSKSGNPVLISALHSDFSQVKEKRFVDQGVDVEYVGQMHVRKQGDRKYYFNSFRLITVSILSTLALIRAGLRAKADVLHICKAHPMNGIAAWVVHKIHGTRIYLDADDYETLNNRFSASWQQRVVAWFENWIPTFCKAISVSNSFLLDHYSIHGFDPECIFVVPHGFDPDRFSVLDHPGAGEVISKLKDQLEIPQADKVITYIGSMSLHNHAIDLALHSFKSLLEEIPNAILLLVGGGEDIEKLQHLAHELGISNRVRFVSRIPANDIPYYYGLADVSIDPKRDTRTAQSSFSIKLIESIAARVPCVAADIGDSKERLGGAGILVKPGDRDSLTEGMKLALTNEVRHSSMRNSATEIRTSYSWDSLLSRFVQVYQC